MEQVLFPYIFFKCLLTNLVVYLVQANLDLRNSIFPFLKRELFNLRNIYVLNLKTSRPKKMPYEGEFASCDLS